MNARVRSIVISVAVVVVVVVVIAIAVTRDAGGADALTVNGESVSQATINNELDTLAANKLVTTNSQGSVDARSAAQWLTTRVRSIAVTQLVRENDLEITSNERDQVRSQLPAGFGKLPRATQQLVVDYSAGGLLLTDKLGEDATTTALVKAVRKLDIGVDPKYGRWNPARAEVCPPVGCAPASSNGS
jgi:hypothetical protein